MHEDLKRVRREMHPARRMRKWLASAVMLLVVAAGVWIYRDFRNNVRLSAKDTIVLAVSNRTRDPVFDDAVYIALHASLQQTPYLNIQSENKVRGILITLHLSHDAKAPPNIPLASCL